MERERAGNPALLVLDTGGVFLKNPGDAANAPLVELVATTMIEGLEMIGYDALNLGPAELLLGRSLLRSLAARAPFPLLSANTVDAGGMTPFPGQLVKEVEGGYRIGIFGLSGTQALPAPPLPERELTAQDPVEAARRAVTELRRTCQLVIVLSQLGLDEDVRLARAVPGIDVILGGFTRMATPAPRIEGSTMILHPGSKGMQLGRLELQIFPGAAGAWTARAAAGGDEARIYDWKLVPLNAALPDHSGLTALLERHREALRERHLADQAAQPPAHQAAPGSVAAARPAYVGAAACGVCHPVQLRQWAASGHARALDALARKRQELNPECLGCHVTAYREVGGYQPGQKGGVDLGHVQCEACHGFGREHRGKGRIRGRVPEAVCRRCHTIENSPTFRYEPYLKQLGEHTARHFTRAHVPAIPDSQR